MSLEGSDTYLKEMLDMTETTINSEQDSDVIKFFTGQTVLITGGSGFVGKLLIEKLLRTCPNIARLYVFMRPKKGKSTEERFKEQFEDPIFQRLLNEQPDYAKKVVMIAGDTAFVDLGLSPEDKNRIRNTDIIFHGAATVRFDEKLRVATNINVRGTKQLLLLAKQMPNLKAFVHISTAFSHCVQKFIDEKFYSPPMEPDKLITLLDVLDDTTLEKITPHIIGKFPNTYAFTKAVAEHVIQVYSKGIATCIVRPSIVTATSEEPQPGWINNFYGPTGVVVGAGIGLLRTLHCKSENVADIIPADYVIANIIVAAWDTAKKGLSPVMPVTNGTIKTIDCVATNTCTTIKPECENSNVTQVGSEGSVVTVNNTTFGNEEICIYNTVSSCQNPITWGEFMKLNENYGAEVPTELILWYYVFTLNRYLIVHNVYVFFLHLVPAAITDTLAYLTGRKPMLMDAYRKIHKFSGVISYFSTQQWRFKNANVLKLWEKLGPTDRELFNFNLNNLDWNQYFYFHIRGLRMYILKDPLDTVEKGRVKWQRLKFAHYTLVSILYSILAWCVYKLCVYIYSW